MSHNKSQISEAAADGQESKVNRRRKVLGIGTVAPMVLTLNPGSSFAMSLNCGQRQTATTNTDADLATTLSDAGDEWARVRVVVHDLSADDGTGQITALPGKYVRVQGTTSNYWRVDDPVGGYYSIATDSSKVQVTGSQTKLAKIRVDPNNPSNTWYSWESNGGGGGIHVSNACLASMTMAKKGREPGRRFWSRR